jgi:hypothetical protein
LVDPHILETKGLQLDDQRRLDGVLYIPGSGYFVDPRGGPVIGRRASGC